MIDAIRRYLQGYPGLRDGVLHLDGLPEQSYTYSLSVIPCQPVLKRYMDGGERRKSLFLLQSRRFLGENLPGQSENCSFSPTLMHGSGEKMPPGNCRSWGRTGFAWK